LAATTVGRIVHGGGDQFPPMPEQRNGDGFSQVLARAFQEIVAEHKGEHLAAAGREVHIGQSGADQSLSW